MCHNQYCTVQRLKYNFLFGLAIKDAMPVTEFFTSYFLTIPKQWILLPYIIYLNIYMKLPKQAFNAC